MDAHKKVTPSVIWSIVGTAGVACSGVLVETSMNVTFPTLMKVFNQSLNNVQWITTAYLLAVTLTIVLAAYLQRSFKFKSLIIAAGTASVIGGVICMVSTTLPIMLLGRIIQGIGTGIAMPLLFSIIMLEVPRAKQGSFVGTAGMIIALAPSLGPTYGGICLSALNWRFNFIFVLPISLIFCLIAVRFMGDNHPNRESFNLPEYLAIVVGLIALTLAVNNLSKGFANPIVWGGLLIAIAAFWAFFTMAKQEGKAHIINIGVFKNTSFNLGLLIYTFLQFIQISLTFVIPNLAQLGLKTSALTSGMLLLLGSLLSAFFGPVMGRLLDSQGFKKLFLIGSCLAMAGILLYIIFAQKLSDLPRHVHDWLQHDVQQLHDDWTPAAGSHAYCRRQRPLQHAAAVLRFNRDGCHVRNYCHRRQPLPRTEQAGGHGLTSRLHRPVCLHHLDFCLRLELDQA